jgi:uncharacterized protein YabE (DUF348 family)
LNLAKTAVKKLIIVKYSLILTGVLIACLMISATLFTWKVKKVTINDDGQIEEIITRSDTVEELLNDAGITVSGVDKVSLDTEDESDVQNVINSGDVILIDRAVEVTVNADGESKELWTLKDTLGEVLAENNIMVNGQDKIEGAAIDDPVYDGMTATLIRVNERLESESESIAYQVENLPNDSMDEGTVNVAQTGAEGVRTKTYKVTLEDGEEVNKELISDEITSQPVNQIVEYGTILNFSNSRGDIVRYSKVLDDPKITATAYTNTPKWGDTTYSGMKTRPGIIAVDTNVIPLGTKVYIESVDGSPDYGYAIAADIGSGVTYPNIIDLYMYDVNDCTQWGLRHVKVYILNDQSVDVFALRK